MVRTATAATPSIDTTAVPDRRRWLVLLAMVFGLFMPMLDHLVVNVALPTIQRELDAGISGLQWIVDAYTLTFAALLLTGGALGDRYGRKRFYLAGLAVFTSASALSGLSTSTAELVATRALQGVGAALLVPGTLSIISATFSGKERGAAIGIWGAIGGLAIAIGPVLGGYLVEHVSWQSVFFINVPIGIAAFAFAAAVVPSSRDLTGQRRVDAPGLVLGTSAVIALTYALIEGNSRGWTDPAIVAAFAAAGVLGAGFVLLEARTSSPMLPLSLFRNTTFSAANAVAALMFFAMIGSVFFLALYLQNVAGYSPAQAGVRLLPFSVTILVLAPIAGKASDRIGSRGFMTVGPLLAAGGLALLLRAGADSAYASVLLPSFVVMGAGWAIALAPMTSAVMGSVGAERAGVASAVVNTSRELGGVLGVAALGAIVTSAFEHTLSERLTTSGVPTARVARLIAGVGGGATSGADVGDPALVEAMRASFVGAVHRGTVVAIVAMLVASCVSFAFIRDHVTPDGRR